MELSLATARALTLLQGFEWSDAELEALRPVADGMLRGLERLETLGLGALDPTVQYRIL